MSVFFSQCIELDQCGVLYNTNKSSRWIHPTGAVIEAEPLLDRYEYFLRQKKDVSPLSVLELGAGPDDNIGASMRCWKAYFKDTSDLNVADIKESAGALAAEGFKVHIGDLGEKLFLEQLASKQWDFVLDDASHFWKHQILAFQYLFPAVKPGGIFIMEDLCTSYGDIRKEYNADPEQNDAVNYFLALSRAACGGTFDNDAGNVHKIFALDARDYALAKTIDMLSWMGNSCILVKK